tara:strand:- start:204 stop:503 length:300 start_codon:yes stop_codon:yes gene_type:complete
MINKIEKNMELYRKFLLKDYENLEHRAELISLTDSLFLKSKKILASNETKILWIVLTIGEEFGISASQAKKIYLSISENERASVNETLNNVLQDFGKVV